MMTFEEVDFKIPGQALKSLFSVVTEDSRSRFLLNLVGESQNDKVSSLVHL